MRKGESSNKKGRREAASSHPSKILGSRKGILAYLAKRRDPSFTASKDLGHLAKEEVRLPPFAHCGASVLVLGREVGSHRLPLLHQSALFLDRMQPRLGKSPTQKAPSSPGKSEAEEPYRLHQNLLLPLKTRRRAPPFIAGGKSQASSIDLHVTQTKNAGLKYNANRVSSPHPPFVLGELFHELSVWSSLLCLLSSVGKESPVLLTSAGAATPGPGAAKTLCPPPSLPRGPRAVSAGAGPCNAPCAERAQPAVYGWAAPWHAGLPSHQTKRGLSLWEARNQISHQVLASLLTSRQGTQEQRPPLVGKSDWGQVGYSATAQDLCWAFQKQLLHFMLVRLRLHRRFLSQGSPISPTEAREKHRRSSPLGFSPGLTREQHWQERPGQCSPHLLSCSLWVPSLWVEGSPVVA